MRQPAFLDQSLFDGLAQKASESPRGRQHHNFHQMEEPCHRMAVGLQPHTYIPPHRHLSDDKAEALIVLKGCLGLLIFDDQGEVIDKRVLLAGGECKAGPHRPVGEGEHAHWAPREGEAGVTEYHAWMRAQFD